MKNLIIILCFLVFVSQCSATASKRSAGEVIDDDVIVVKLKTKYLDDKIVHANHVKVKCWKGVVTLRGTAESQEELDRSIELAERQQGVKEVKAYLVLQGVPEPIISNSTPPKKSRTSHTDPHGLQETDIGSSQTSTADIKIVDAKEPINTSNVKAGSKQKDPNFEEVGY